MQMRKFFLFFVLFLSLLQTLYAEEIGVDCLILEDENSIICKYNTLRVDYEKNILIQWIEPDKTITRERVVTIPANHGSIYDYRYIEGRTKGIWTFKVIDEGKEYTTNFTIE